MPILLTCPTCSEQSAVADDFGADSVQCPHCHELMVVPHGAGIGAVTNSLPDNSPPPVPAVWVQPAAAIAEYVCGSCGQPVSVDDLVEEHGNMICRACHAAHAAAAEAAAHEVHDDHPHDDHSHESTSELSADLPVEADEPVPDIMDRCGGCGGPFSSALLHPVNGKLLCVACAAAEGVVVAPPMESDSGQSVIGHEEHNDSADHHHAGESMVDMGSGRHSDASPAFIAPARKRPDPLVWGIGGGIAAAALVGLFIFLSQKDNKPVVVTHPVSRSGESGQIETGVAGTRPTVTTAESIEAWEKKYSGTLQSLQKQAKGRSGRKDFEGADQTYAEMFALVRTAGGPLKDPALKSLTDSAQSEWNAVKKQMGKPVGPDSPTTVATTQEAPVESAPKEQKEKVERLIAEAEFASKNGDKVAAYNRYKDLFEYARQTPIPRGDRALQAAMATARSNQIDVVDELRKRPDGFKATSAALLKQGIKSLHEQKWQAGLDSLYDVKLMMEKRIEDASKIAEADYITALHGIAVAYLATGQLPRAAQMFDDSETLGITVKNKPTRELILNRAVIDITEKSRVMRTVAALADELKKDEQKAEESILNMYGTAIAIAYQQPGADTEALQEAVAYYKTRNTQLEATKPGSMHWGVKWVEGEAAISLAKQKEDAEKAYKVRQNELNILKKKLEDVKKGERTAIKRGKSTIYVTKVNPERLKATQAEYQAKVKEVNDARAKVPRAEWLTDLKPVVPGGPPSIAKPPPGSADVKPARYAVAFPVDRYRLLTASEPLGSAQKVRLEDNGGSLIGATVIYKDDKLALLEVNPGDVGGGMKYFNFAIGFSGGPVKCVCLPVPSIFGPWPEIIKGKDAPDPTTSGNWIVSLDNHPRLSGAPLLDGSQRLVGVVLARRDESKEQLPAISLLAMQDFLQKGDALPADESEGADPMGIYQVIVDLE